jgi:hypothetical protein
MARDKNGNLYSNKKGVSNIEYMRIRREQARQKGTCAHHPERKAKLGTIICSECAERDTNRHNALKEKGICPSHLDSLATAGRTICEKCVVSKRLNNLRKDGVSKDEIMKARQAWSNFDGKCQACGSTESGTKGWCLDHSHELKKFRGIICSPCNLCLGHAQDNLGRLEAITEYRRQHGE